MKELFDTSMAEYTKQLDSEKASLREAVQFLREETGLKADKSQLKSVQSKYEAVEK